MTDYERGVEQATALYKEVIREYVVENNNLRKLVDGWDFCSKTKNPTFDECVGCPLFEQSPHGYRCTRSECMRELGIEVD